MGQTLQVRDLDESVVRTLKARAAQQRMSLSAYVAARLTEIASRPTNEEVVARILARPRDPDGPSIDDVLTAVQEGRQR